MNTTFPRGIAGLFAAALVGAAGCSGGGSSSDVSSMPGPPIVRTANVRVINAATRMGSLSFTSGTLQVTVEARSASPIFTVPAGSATFTAANGTTSATQVIAVPEGSSIDVVGFEAPAGSLSLDSFPGQVTGADTTRALVTYFNYGDAVFPAGDAYIVPVGTNIASVAAIFPAGSGVRGGGSLSFAPGTYNFLLTPSNSKTVLFQSAPLTLSAGEQLVLVSAPATPSVLAPQPIVVTFGEASSSLENNAPLATVRVLRRLDQISPFDVQPVTLMVDGSAVAQLPSADAAANYTYTLPAGSRLFSDNLSTITYSEQVQAGFQYVQEFGFYPFGAVSSRDIWLPPDIANDYPAPADKARVHLIVETNTCYSEAVMIDGVSVQYPDQTWRNAGIALDRAPGPINITAGVGTLGFVLKAGHYYVIRANEFNYIEFPPYNCSHRNFEVSGDE